MGSFFGGPTMVEIARIFKKSSHFNKIFAKISCSPLVDIFPKPSTPRRHRPPPGAIGNPEQTPICDSNQMNGPPRAGAARVSDRHTPYGIFFNLKRSAIWPKISRKADRESSICKSFERKPIGLLLFSPIIIISYFFIKINPNGPRVPDR